MPRLTVQQPEWKEKEQLEKAEVASKLEFSEMVKLKDRVVANALLSHTNPKLICRKRPMDSKGAKTTPVAVNKARVTGIKTCDGSWDSKKSKFIRRQASSPAMSSTPSTGRSVPLRVESVSSIEDEDKLRLSWAKLSKAGTEMGKIGWLLDES